MQVFLALYVNTVPTTKGSVSWSVYMRAHKQWSRMCTKLPIEKNMMMNDDHDDGMSFAAAGQNCPDFSSG